MEDKSKIYRLFLPVLQEMRGLRDLIGLEYIPEKECVVASFMDRSPVSVCVACDSGSALVMDIIKHLI